MFRFGGGDRVAVASALHSGIFGRQLALQIIRNSIVNCTTKGFEQIKQLNESP